MKREDFTKAVNKLGSQIIDTDWNSRDVVADFKQQYSDDILIIEYILETKNRRKFHTIYRQLRNKFEFNYHELTKEAGEDNLKLGMAAMEPLPFFKGASNDCYLFMFNRELLTQEQKNTLVTFKLLI